MRRKKFSDRTTIPLKLKIKNNGLITEISFDFITNKFSKLFFCILYINRYNAVLVLV